MMMTTPRPRFRFAPASGWINDPNGPIWLDGQYHLFFQQNPDGPNWGEIGWGHAVSDNLTGWQELEPALRPAGGAMAYSGSVVFDRENRSDLGSTDQPPLVAAYTAHRSEPERRETQELAWSVDGGRRWTRYGGNPVLDRGQADFRDPKVFWHEPSEAWIMAVVLPCEQRLLIYRSSDLRDWRETSTFAPQADAGELWECPDLFELAVEGRPGESRWVLKVDANVRGRTAVRGARLYVGDFDGFVFRPEQEPFHADHGSDFYAALSWANLPPDHPVIWIAWLSNWAYTSQVPADGWRGSMTLPRSLSLRVTNEGLRLVQRLPASLLAALGEPLKVTIAQSATPTVLAASGTFYAILDEVPDDCRATVQLQSDRGCEARLDYLPFEGLLRVERRGTPELAGRGFETPAHISVRSLSGLQIVVDAGSMELFADDGETVASFQLALSAAVSELVVSASTSLHVASEA